MSNPSATKKITPASAKSEDTKTATNKATAHQQSSRILSEREPSATSQSAAEYIYNSMRDTTNPNDQHKMMIQTRPGIGKVGSSNNSIKSRFGLDKTSSNTSMMSASEKIGSNRSLMSGLLSMDMFPEDVDLHGGLFSLQADSKRSINSSDFVKNTFLSDNAPISIPRNVPDKELMNSDDPPMLDLTLKLERVTTGDDIMVENIRLSSSEWVKDFQDDVVDGPMPKSMFYDSSTSIPAVPPPTTACQTEVTPDPSHFEDFNKNATDNNFVVNTSTANNTSPSLPSTSPSGLTTSEEYSPLNETSLNPNQPPTTSKTKKRRKRVIDESHVCVPTDDDVLFGRGGFTNNRPGNIFFRQEALRLRPWYEQSSKEEKYEISNILLESVKSKGGRFLEKGTDGQWHEVIGNGARRKASQALRERIKGRGASMLSSSIRSRGSSDDEHEVSADNESLSPAEKNFVEV